MVNSNINGFSVNSQHSTLRPDKSVSRVAFPKIPIDEVSKERLEHVYTKLARQKSANDFYLSRGQYEEANHRTDRTPRHETYRGRFVY